MSDRSLNIALVSMPWMSTRFPSIQLATLASVFEERGHKTETIELSLDYAAMIGPSIYDRLCNGGGFIEELIFAEQYYGKEHRPFFEESRNKVLPIGLFEPEVEQSLIAALNPLTERYLDLCADAADWSKYDAIGFSLTISQTTASAAMAKRIRQKVGKDVRIIIGGSSCAGEMGIANLHAFPEFDAAVHCEVEMVADAMLAAIPSGDFSEIDGISFRNQDGRVIEGKWELEGIARPPAENLNFDSYFSRLDVLGLRDQIDPWLPFESSRGCWYGEKQQCTFCGLHEIMKYRHSPGEETLARLDSLEKRYNVSSFFSVDLIMPQKYYKEFLPELAESSRDWNLFYEIKANVRRYQVELLAAAGVNWVQPGIESLSTSHLKLMKKGVRAIQNIQLLKWCSEMGIHVTWNIIIGMPNETNQMFQDMLSIIPNLFHLQPPSGAANFSLHRFSPFFEDADTFGIVKEGADPRYNAIHPLDASLVDRLAYRYEFTDQSAKNVDPTLPEQLSALIAQWQAAHRRGAELAVSMDKGEVIVKDTRHSEQAIYYRLRPEEWSILTELQEARFTKDVLSDLEDLLQSRSDAEAKLKLWAEIGLICDLDERTLSLVRHDNATQMPSETTNAQAPHPYLVEVS